MPFEFDIANLFAAQRIDDCKSALAVTDDYSMRIRIDAYIVGILAQINATHGSQISPLKELHRTIVGIGNIQGVGARLVSRALRLMQSGESSQHHVTGKIHHAHRVIAELSYKEALTRDIDSQVIDSTPHLAQGNLDLQHQRRIGRPGGRGENRRTHRGCNRNESPHSKGSDTDALANVMIA